MTRLTVESFATPIGPFEIAVHGEAVAAAHLERFAERSWDHLRRRWPDADVEAGPAPDAVARRVRDYFDGDRGALAEIAVAPRGTPFQCDVWAGLRAIPAGETRAYRDLAEAVGRPAATRAVAQANRANPISIIVPCHRVLGADGSLTGYGGKDPKGLELKAWLLAHEGASPRLL
jgi:O-6-methylguanine DNA methyltransferase